MKTTNKPKPVPLDLLEKWFKPLDGETRPTQQRPSYLGRTKDQQRVMIRHRVDCRHWSGGKCDCDPEIVSNQAMVEQ